MASMVRDIWYTLYVWWGSKQKYQAGSPSASRIVIVVYDAKAWLGLAWLTALGTWIRKSQQIT